MSSSGLYRAVLNISVSWRESLQPCNCCSVQLEDEKTLVVLTYHTGVRPLLLSCHVSIGLLLCNFQKHFNDLVPGKLPCIDLVLWLRRPWSPATACSVVMVYSWVEPAMPFHSQCAMMWWARIRASLCVGQRHWMWLCVSAGWQQRVQAAEGTCRAGFWWSDSVTEKSPLCIVLSSCMELRLLSVQLGKGRDP
jgi:hypothetical protein